MKHVCMVCQSYYLRDPRVRREAEALAEAGYSVDVITLKDKGESYKENAFRVNIYRVPLRRRRGNIVRYLFEYLCFFTLSSVFLIYLTIKQRYELIQIHNMPDFLVFTGIIPRMFGARIILDVHDPMPELYMSKYKLLENNFLIKLIKIQEKMSFWFPNHVITVNEPLRQLFIKSGIVDENRISVILNAPDTRIFGGFQLRKVVKRDDRFVVIYTGTVAERYGLDLAVRSLDILRKKIPNLRLLIVGDGDHLPFLKNLVEQSHVKPYVEFHEPVPINQIPEFLTSAHVGFSAHKQDSFTDIMLPTKIIEFFMMGLPVVVSKTEAIQYYFDEDMLFYFIPGDIEDFARQVLFVYKNQLKAREAVKRARDYIVNIGWNVEKKKYVDLIESFVITSQM